MNTELEILSTINPVDAPPFLFTSIQQKIQNRKAEMISPKLTYLVAIAAVLLIVFNTLFIYNNYQQKGPKADIAKSMNLLQDNSLYK